MDDEPSRVRAEVLRLLEGRRSVRIRDVMATLDVRAGAVGREMTQMKREGLLDGRAKQDLYWLKRLDGSRPIVASVVPTINGERRDEHQHLDCIDPSLKDDEIGQMMGACLRNLAANGFAIGDGSAIVVSMRLS